ncbi:MAG: hypothetical protein B6D55_07135 [Candidatus Omnitrophica bacterium 4484_70.2]|nr:MAG: hypothetical protein B6D55_07135 [Candidatus Omnitrophica bacterium 4484_70.2]
MERHKILIVDDEPHILSLLKKILEEGNREVLTAKSAEEAWQLLKEKGEVGVIICDHRLPNMSGVDFLVKVKRLYPDTIRILVTGYPEISTAVEAINKAHIWRYILKPIDVDNLKILIKQAFEYYRILKENRLLLKIARQQKEWIEAMKKEFPEIINQKLNESSSELDEKKMTEIIEEFTKRYYNQK